MSMECRINKKLSQTLHTHVMIEVFAAVIREPRDFK